MTKQRLLHHARSFQQSAFYWEELLIECRSEKPSYLLDKMETMCEKKANGAAKSAEYYYELAATKQF